MCCIWVWGICFGIDVGHVEMEVVFGHGLVLALDVGEAWTAQSWSFGRLEDLYSCWGRNCFDFVQGPVLFYGENRRRELKQDKPLDPIYHGA